MGVAPQSEDDEIITVGTPMPKVVQVEIVAPLTLFVRYDDKTEGLVRFEAERLVGVQHLLADHDFFAAVSIEHGTLGWPQEMYGLCPDTMQKEIVAGDGEWVVTRPFKYMPEITNDPRAEAL